MTTLESAARVGAPARARSVTLGHPWAVAEPDALGSADPLVIAHRGDSQSVRENTLAAVESAVLAGADAVEVDVQLAADGTLVVVHDDTFERLWGDPRPVASMTWSEIARLGSGDQ